jgi:hypothetical protein
VGISVDMVRPFILVIIFCALGLVGCRPTMPPPGPIVSPMYPMPAYIEGKNRTAAQIESLKATLEKDQNNSWSNAFNRIELLGYYNERRDPESQAIAREQIVWIATNAPTVNLSVFRVDFGPLVRKDEIKRLKQLLLEQVEKNSTEPIVFCNAAHFLLWDDNNKVEELLDRASKLPTKNPDICGMIGKYYSVCSISQNTSEQRDRLVLKSIAQYEKAVALIDSSKFTLYLSRAEALAELTKATYRIGQTDRSAKYATELLQTLQSNPKTTRDRSEHINLANTVLGLKAIENGDIDGASNYLIESAKSGEKLWQSQGANMCLAARLLDSGKRRVVMQYLHACETIWPQALEALHRWESMIDNGQNPPFYCDADTW